MFNLRYGFLFSKLSFILLGGFWALKVSKVYKFYQNRKTETHIHKMFPQNSFHISKMIKIGIKPSFKQKSENTFSHRICVTVFCSFISAYVVFPLASIYFNNIILGTFTLHGIFCVYSVI